MTDTAWFSVQDHKPLTPGWYPTLVCWDPREGCFPTAVHWTPGPTGWGSYAVVLFVPTVCVSEKEAEIVAYRHDPDW